MSSGKEELRNSTRSTSLLSKLHYRQLASLSDRFHIVNIDEENIKTSVAEALTGAT